MPVNISAVDVDKIRPELRELATRLNKAHVMGVNSCSFPPGIVNGTNICFILSILQVLLK